MELKDTIELMQSNDYVDRFKAEYYQLKIRTQKLSDMLEKYKEGTLPFTPKCSYELFEAQLKAMDAYVFYLEQRATIEGVDLI